MCGVDRYGLQDMRALCESMLQPNAANWLDLQRAASMLDAPLLLAETQAFVRNNSDLVAEAMEGIQADYPALAEELQEGYSSSDERSLAQRSPGELYKARIRNNALEREEGRKRSASVPVWTLPLLVLFALGYNHLVTTVELGYLIPVINIVATVTFVVFGCVYAGAGR